MSVVVCVFDVVLFLVVVLVFVVVVLVFLRVEGGRGEGKSRERTMPRRAELSEPFSLAFTGEEGGSAPAPLRGEAFPVGDQRRPEHAAVGEQHQLVWLRGRPAPRPRASPTTDPPKPWLWNAGDGEELRGSWPQPGLGQTGSMWHSSDLQLRTRGPRTCTGWSRQAPGLSLIHISEPTRPY